jgi:hypothetical protein
VEQSDALRIAEIEKPNAFEIHEIHFLQIEDKTWTAADDLGFHLVDVLTSQLPAQANSRSALAGDLLNLQRHLSHGSRAPTLEGNWVAILNWLKKRDLGEEGDARLRANGVRWANARGQ